MTIAYPDMVRGLVCTNISRLVNSEGDRLSGVLVDVLGDVAVSMML